MSEEGENTKTDPRTKIEDQYKSNISDVIGYYRWMASLAIFVLTVTAAAVIVPETPIEFVWFFIVGWGFLGICVYCNVFVINKLLTISGVWSTPPEMRTPEQKRQLQEPDPMKFYAIVQQRAFYTGAMVVLAGVIANLFS